MEPFKLPQSNYDALSRIVLAYGSKDKPSLLAEIANIATLDASTVSRNHAFLTNIGIIEGKNQKQATPKGRELARAMEHKVAEDISRVWRETIQDLDFTKQIVAATRIRNGMDREALQSHIVYTSGQTKNQLNNSGALAFIEILSIAGLLREDDGLLTVNFASTISSDPTPSSGRTDELGHGKEEVPSDSTVSSQTVAAGSIQVVVHFNIAVSPNDLDGIGEKLGWELKKLMDSYGTDSATTDIVMETSNGDSIA